MASKTSSSFLAVLLVFNVLLALAGHAVARRNTPKSSKNLDKKQPQFLIDSDGSFLIPGIGRVVLPPKYTHLPFGPFTGHTGAGGIGLRVRRNRVRIRVRVRVGPQLHPRW
ncbi:Cell wall protein [Quillaja saponaria]|uniref:Cell wall protein n=1 Tax=Quillaja saponaria TaxID=32244 RepID=A0AAD7QH79_QUISA|nr:Cell wall protein [Quillaja saponaria]